jgi:hypothetical protein
MLVSPGKSVLRIVAASIALCIALAGFTSTASAHTAIPGNFTGYAYFCADTGLYAGYTDMFVPRAVSTKGKTTTYAYDYAGSWLNGYYGGAINPYAPYVTPFASVHKKLSGYHLITFEGWASDYVRVVKTADLGTSVACV